MKYFLLILICVIHLLLFTVCDSSNKGYKSITVENELCSFSFQYPAYYELHGPWTDLDRIIPSTDILLSAQIESEPVEVPDLDSGEIKTVIGHRSPSGISIEVYNPSQYESAPQTAQERIEGTLAGGASWTNFKLLERSPITVSGVEGEMIVYLIDRIRE